MRECVIHGVMVSIAAFQADDPGSIPAWGSIFLGLHSNTESLFPIFHQHGHILPKKNFYVYIQMLNLYFPFFTNMDTFCQKYIGLLFLFIPLARELSVRNYQKLLHLLA